MLRPGINPFEAASMDEDRKRLERTMAVREFRQGMKDRTNLYNEMKKRTGSGMKTMEVRDQHYSFPSAEELSKKMDARQRVATPGMRTMEFRYGRDEKPLRTLPAYGPGPGEMERYRTPTAPGMTNMGGIPAAPGMGPGMAMTGGFDASDLMKTPGMIQQSTRDQAEKVSAPYREANMMAADKTNPMNAASQEPGRSFLMKYIGK